MQTETSPERPSHGLSIPSWRWMGTAIAMIVGALTAYYTTVYGIRLTINDKADRVSVVDLDRRLVAIETTLRTDIAHRDDLYRFESTFERRLTRIETLLQQSATGP